MLALAKSREDPADDSIDTKECTDADKKDFKANADFNKACKDSGEYFAKGDDSLCCKKARRRSHKKRRAYRLK